MLSDDEGRLLIGKGVKLNPYKPPVPIYREYMTESEIRSNAGSDIILDSESFPNYFLVGFKHPVLNKYIRMDGDFQPHFLSWILFSYRTIGFNSLTYDLPMLWAAYTNRDPEYLKDVSDALIRKGYRVNEAEKEFNFKCYPLGDRKHIDLINVCPLKGSLKLYGARIHSPRIQDLPIDDRTYLTKEEIEIVVQYNCNDLDVTHQIKDFCKERIELREAISLEYDVDLMSKADAQMAEVVIAKKVSELNGKWCKRPEIQAGTIFKYNVPHYLQYATPQMQSILEKVRNASFIVQDSGKIKLPEELDTAIRLGDGIYKIGIGGLHSYEKNIGYQADNTYCIIDRDVTSYYPRIITSLGLYPTGMGPNFLKVYNGFIEERVVAKAAKNFTKDKGLKVFINGTSGKFSDFWSKMYSPDLTIQVTVTGQLALLLLIEMFECQGIKVISANTDGIVIYAKRNDIDKINYWVNFWEDLTGFKTEDTQYSGYYARDVNSYFAVKTNGEVKVKGPYSEVGSQSGTQLDNNPITLICSDAIKRLLSNNVPIEHTINTCSDIRRFIVVRQVKGGAVFRGDYLGRVVRWYHSNKSYDYIQYATNGNKVADSDNCIPCMDLPTQLPADLDYQFYINKTVDILHDIDYYKRPKQLEFF